MRTVNLPYYPADPGRRAGVQREIVRPFLKGYLDGLAFKDLPETASGLGDIVGMTIKQSASEDVLQMPSQKFVSRNKPIGKEDMLSVIGTKDRFRG